MATTTPNFGWSVPTSTDLVKDGATAIETLGDSIDASLARIAFAARINTNQSIPNSAWTKVAFDTEVYDSGTVYDPTTNYRFTVPTGQGGRYLIGADIAWGVYTAGHQSIIAFYKNGSAPSQFFYAWRDGGTDVVSGGVSQLFNLNAGDYIECYVFQSSGVSRTLYSPNANFWGHKI